MAKITFRIFTWKSYFHNQYHVKDRESCINRIMRWEDILEIIFQSWALQVFWFPQPKIFSSILLISKPFQWMDTFLIPTRMLFWWKNTQRKTLFLSSLFFLPASPSDHLPKISHFKRENPNGLVGLLWKACWSEIFQWVRRGTLWIYLAKLQ